MKFRRPSKYWFRQPMNKMDKFSIPTIHNGAMMIADGTSKRWMKPVAFTSNFANPALEGDKAPFIHRLSA
jgi:hypothetical protein